MLKRLHHHLDNVARRLAMAGALCMMLPSWATETR